MKGTSYFALKQSGDVCVDGCCAFVPRGGCELLGDGPEKDDSLSYVFNSNCYTRRADRAGRNVPEPGSEKASHLLYRYQNGAAWAERVALNDESVAFLATSVP